jgi:dihydrofolate reductase
MRKRGQSALENIIIHSGGTTCPPLLNNQKGPEMSKIVVFISLTLDGVMQAPGRPDEDRRDGFEHGGWATPYATMEASEGSMGNAGAILLGRRTYEDFYTFWPNQTDDNPFTEVLNTTQKYVASTSLSEPLPWMNSTLLGGNAAEAEAKLKKEPGKDIVILGSGVLVQSLMRHNLIDSYVLLIHPLVLGSGRRLFTDGGPVATLRVVSTKTTSTGIVIMTYQPIETTA